MIKVFKKVIKWLLSPFIWLACLNKSFKALHIFAQVERLEREKKTDEARKLRKIWLLKLPPKYTGPLWRQEGNDLLYDKKDYERSLKAFENASKAIGENPAHYGVADPIQIFYGATISSIKLDLKDKAKKYFQEFLSRYESYSQSDNLRVSVTKYDKGIKWIRENLKV